ncbi:MAG: PilZ domain-containing protein [Panacagrimonas sp.]
MNAAPVGSADVASAAVAEDARQSWDLLATLCAQRALLSVGIVGEAPAGASMMIGVDAERGQFLLDVLRQPGSLAAGSSLYFDTQIEGRRLRFEFRLANVIALDDGPAYLATTPRLVMDRQRRNAYRMRLPANLRVLAAVRRDGQKLPLPARLLDLSTRGCSARLESGALLATGDSVSLNLKLLDLDLMCMATIRHIQRLGGAALIGLEFRLDHAAEAAAFEHAVARLQREILRRRSE